MILLLIDLLLFNIIQLYIERITRKTQISVSHLLTVTVQSRGGEILYLNLNNYIIYLISINTHKQVYYINIENVINCYKTTYISNNTSLHYTCIPLRIAKKTYQTLDSCVKTKKSLFIRDKTHYDVQKKCNSWC